MESSCIGLQLGGVHRADAEEFPVLLLEILRVIDGVVRTEGGKTSGGICAPRHP